MTERAATIEDISHLLGLPMTDLQRQGWLVDLHELSEAIQVCCALYPQQSLEEVYTEVITEPKTVQRFKRNIAFNCARLEAAGICTRDELANMIIQTSTNERRIETQLEDLVSRYELRLSLNKIRDTQPMRRPRVISEE